MYDYLVYATLLVSKYQEVIQTLLVLANCALIVTDIILMRKIIEKRQAREAKTLVKLKKFRSTKLGRQYRKAKDEERKMKRRVTDRLRRAKRREKKTEEPMRLVA